MKTLYLLRHAKSSWDDDALHDHDRPLNPRGRRAAPAMGRYLRREGMRPQRILCSSAVRTRQTWELLAPELEEAPEVAVLRELYGAPAPELLERIREVPGEVDRLMLVGHNPGLEELAVGLAGPESPARDRARMLRKYPTAALAVLVAELDAWGSLGPGRMRLERFVRPKDLPEADEERL